MGGFFKCVTHMWHGYQRKKWLETLPTLDVEGEDISPLSEAEEGRSEDEDIRVVENKCFVKPLKSKSGQTWCNDLNQERRSKAGTAGQETSQGRSERIKETPAQPSTSGAEAFSLDAQSSDDSCGVLADRQRNKESSRTDRNYLAQKETLPNPSRKRALCEQEAREEKLYDRGDSSVCELDEVQRIPQQCSQEVRKEQPEPQMKHLNVAKPLTDEVDAKVEKKISSKESFVVIEDCGVKEGTKLTPHLLPMSTEQFEEIGNGLENTSALEETFELSYGKIKGQKTKKPSSATDVTHDGEEHVDGSLSEDAGFLEEASGTPQKKKKKKKKKKQRRGEDVEKSSRAVEPLNDDGAEIKKKKDGEALVFKEECEQKKRSNKTSNLAPHSAEDFEELGNGLSASTETLGLSDVGRKKHKKKHQSCLNEDSQDVEEGVDVGFCHDAVTLKEETEKPQKKKKKKKRHGEDLLQHSTATDHLNDEAGTQTKKKKRKKEKAADVGVECGDNETSKILSDLPLVSTEQFEEP